MINYTNLALFGLGLLGIILHNLVQLNKINRSQNGNVNLFQYFKMEIYSILINVIVLVCALIAKHEIKQLEEASKWLGLSFVTIGYMGQSILIFVMGKTEKKINDNNQ
jgi:hypothetical protein